MPELTTEAACYCPGRGSANLQTRRGYFNLWQAERDKWACWRWLQSSPALDVAVPALLLVRLGHVARAADVVGQVGPEALRFPQLPYDLHHLQQKPKTQKYNLSGPLFETNPHRNDTTVGWIKENVSQKKSRQCDR